jgi:putative hydrolase of the HAD superfamily
VTSRYRAVLLDAGDTLLGPRESYGAVYARTFAGLGVHRSPSAFDEALGAAWAGLDRRTPRGVDRYRYAEGGEDGYWLGFVRAALESLADPPEDPALAVTALPLLREAFRSPDAWIVWPDVVPALDALRARGIRLGVVSNWDSRLPDLLRALGLGHRFEVLAVSSLEGVEKPDPRLFRVALQRLGVPPGDAVHVGDRPDVDGEGAVRAGVDAALVDRRGRLDPGLGAMRTLSALPGLVERGAADGVRIRNGLEAS